MSRTNLGFAKTSKLPWATCAVVLVLVLMLPESSRAQTDNTALNDTVCVVISTSPLLSYCGLTNDTTGSYNSAIGAGALTLNTTGTENTATGYLALYSNKQGGSNTATGGKALYGNTASWNTATGYGTLYLNTSGPGNTADGFKALLTNSTGGYNTAEGYEALYSNSSGSYNTAVGLDALYSNTTGSDLTCVGHNCTTAADALTNATAIGSHAVVGQSDSLVLGGTGQYAVRVGIGTATPSNVLTIGRGMGHPVSDSWETYSSRRWKKNVHPLQNALSKVEQLRGVSYDLKESGKHEIGVIAEEVGQVVPEVVSYEKNGKDATGVDYSRLTALLIEATKEQQALIRKQQQQIHAQQAQMKAQQAEIAHISAQVKTIQASLDTNGQKGSEIRIVKAEMPVVSQ